MVDVKILSRNNQELEIDDIVYILKEVTGDQVERFIENFDFDGTKKNIKLKATGIKEQLKIFSKEIKESLVVKATNEPIEMKVFKGFGMSQLVGVYESFKEINQDFLKIAMAQIQEVAKKA